MLNIYFGDMAEAIYNTSVYFGNTYRDQWLGTDFSKRVILDVDKSKVVSPNLIDSPVLGAISPLQLSGGVKTVLLIKYDRDHIFNASTCGDNCAKWILEIGKDRKTVVNLRHLMDFGEGDFKIKVLNTGKIVKNMAELVYEAAELV